MSTTAVITAPTRNYRGRFAPSPSGPLHFGSLVAAVGSYLDAKSNQGTWLVRIEDIDTTRVAQGAAKDILTTLEAYGLHWDEEVVYQTQRHDLYAHTIEQLNKQQLIYACHCSRKQIKALGGIYQGHCRHLNHSQRHSALRLIQQHPISQYHDLIQGAVTINQELAREDYLIKRSDGLFAYQLVVVADDIDQGITHIVRGADLLEPTARQLSLFKQLNHTAPHYAHLPLAVAQPGFKLSKQNYAPAIAKDNPKPALFNAFEFLGLTPQAELIELSIEKMLCWAITHYSLQSVPKVAEIQVSQNPHSQATLFTHINK
ncbi:MULTISPECIES: tRNA glutamyl-Q(34) synthetase GluQRS [Pseudoalteromonas]|uniref:Glutamyl-Q tRNA(Asp) synthetase n=1 Tax=Pseudoalteromonas haloplanktis TaxID=228 RepID=A0ABU1BCB4_PSEHA|nr:MULTISPECIES: tRNA glutamyl-Q(34) synthetase GluQRS [Pseudoalteromonas]MCF6143967.1 glutamyl-Q tRNA(Asp) synthetase [Pseudoalteromonas mariniglutinosa NCIMB 1770]MDQ9091985.1 tRNA glutamyl-Q(34) synthetase GluQRS [Pseudoalteromonas haloplanktis]BDF93271.1 glutamyl-Q tRNA(Asp) synthetase [Pseudoalteromonas sp. KAN5]